MPNDLWFIITCLEPFLTCSPRGSADVRPRRSPDCSCHPALDHHVLHMHLTPRSPTIPQRHCSHRAGPMHVDIFATVRTARANFRQSRRVPKCARDPAALSLPSCATFPVSPIAVQPLAELLDEPVSTVGPRCTLSHKNARKISKRGTWLWPCRTRCVSRIASATGTHSSRLTPPSLCDSVHFAHVSDQYSDRCWTLT